MTSKTPLRLDYLLMDAIKVNLILNHQGTKAPRTA